MNYNEEIKFISSHEFGMKLETVNRIWDENRKEGLGKNQAANKNISLNDMEHIFVREDGWSIASTGTGYDEAYNLWPEEWRVIYNRQPEEYDSVKIIKQLLAGNHLSNKELKQAGEIVRRLTVELNHRGIKIGD